jgi:hypothetical protein
MRRVIELVYLAAATLLIVLPVVRSGDDDRARPSSGTGAAAAQAAIESYGELLSAIASDAAAALDSGELTTDRQLLEYIDLRRQAAADSAFESLHRHQQQRIGTSEERGFDPARAADLMREYAEGWKR